MIVWAVCLYGTSPFLLSILYNIGECIMKCSICKQEIVSVTRKGKGGIIIRRESCCNITRVREVKAENMDIVKGYTDCKVWR